MTFALEGYGVLLLTAEPKAGIVEVEPIFSPVSGGWGRLGARRVRRTKVPLDLLEGGLRTPWLSSAPKRLLGKKLKL